MSHLKKKCSHILTIFDKKQLISSKRKSSLYFEKSSSANTTRKGDVKIKYAQ